MKRIVTSFIIAFLIGGLSLPSFAGDESVNTKPSFSGVLWASYWHAVSGSPTNVGNGTANSFDIKRVYLTAAGNLDETWSWKVIFEMGGLPQLNAIAKAAFVKWTIPGTMKQSVTFGLQPTLTWATSEYYWGYRVVINAPRELLGSTVVSGSGAMDLNTGTAADFGINYTIKPLEMVGFSLMASNGAGHKARETNMYKKIGMTAGVTVVPNSIIELYVENEGGYTYIDNSGKTQIDSRTAIGVFAGYKIDKFGFGVDYFRKSFPEKTLYDVNGAKLEAVSNVLSIFGNYAIYEKLRLLGRYDMYTPVDEEKLLNGTFTKSGESLLIVGADCSYGPPNTNFILTYQLKSFDAKFNNGSNWVDRDPYGLVALDVSLKF